MKRSTTLLFHCMALYFLRFVPLVIVCSAYSWCFVKSRVDEIEAATKPDPENPRPRPRVKTRKVFCSYFLHLLVRLILGILFTVLQNVVFYAADFPTKFVCLVCDAPDVLKNSSIFNATKVNSSSSAVNCDNSVGSDYVTWARVSVKPGTPRNTPGTPRTHPEHPGTSHNAPEYPQYSQEHP